MYYIINSIKHRRCIVTRSLDKAYDFFMSNIDARVRVMDWEVRPRIMDKRKFIEELYNASEKTHADKQRVFKITKRSIKGKNNKRDFLVSMGLYKDYLKWQEVTKNML